MGNEPEPNREDFTMPVELSDDLREALTKEGGGPVEVVDPRTNAGYVLVSRETYERLKPLFQPDPMTREEQRSLLADAGQRAGWDDEAMDAYDRYDELRGATM